MPDTTIPDEPGGGRKQTMRILSGAQKKMKNHSPLSFLSFFRRISIARAIFMPLGGYSGGREMETASFLKKDTRQMPGLSSAPNALQHLSVLSRRAKIADMRV